MCVIPHAIEHAFLLNEESFSYCLLLTLESVKTGGTTINILLFFYPNGKLVSPSLRTRMSPIIPFASFHLCFDYKTVILTADELLYTLELQNQRRT